MFGKKKKKEEKKKSTLDKLIMGAIVGGAVGSVIGMSIAPQKGKETREMIAQKGKEIIKKGQETIEKMTEKRPEPEEVSEEKQRKKSLLARIFGRGKGKKVKKGIMREDDMRKIPNETPGRM